MDQVPHWLEKTIFAAGMTAYAVEVDQHDASGPAAPTGSAAMDAEPPDSYH